MRPERQLTGERDGERGGRPEPSHPASDGGGRS